ncbi:MAG: hypothetical protein VX519_04935 [Myxococcota bacterium]|nr:hypothetical protein [Myxococcota bacterium]
MLLLGCPHAVEVSDQGLLGRMSLEIPARWEVVKNRRFLGNQMVVLRSPDGCCTVQAHLIPENHKSRAVPLDILADTLSMSSAYLRGFHSELLGSNTIELDGREAWATVVRRYHGPHERLYTTVITRIPEHVVQLSLEAPFTAPLSVTTAWQAVLETFSLPEDPPEASPLFEPLPQGLEEVGSVD